jgi:hypothetical protein
VSHAITTRRVRGREHVNDMREIVHGASELASLPLSSQRRQSPCNVCAADGMAFGSSGSLKHRQLIRCGVIAEDQFHTDAQHCLRFSLHSLTSPCRIREEWNGRCQGPKVAFAGIVTGMRPILTTSNQCVGGGCPTDSVPGGKHCHGYLKYPGVLLWFAPTSSTVQLLTSACVL